SDSGTGMDAQTKSHIFEPFFTTKEKGKGTGLGLATVYGVVKQSGGYIWVYSEPGQGTAFKIYLPRVTETPDATRRRSTPAAPRGGSETVLLVEEDEMVRKLTRRMLSNRGYAVLAAADGGDALRQLESHPGSVDLLVTDVVMPGMSGREVAQRLLVLRPGPHGRQPRASRLDPARLGPPRRRRVSRPGTAAQDRGARHHPSTHCDRPQRCRHPEARRGDGCRPGAHQARGHRGAARRGARGPGDEAGVTLLHAPARPSHIET